MFGHIHLFVKFKYKLQTTKEEVKDVVATTTAAVFNTLLRLGSANAGVTLKCRHRSLKAFFYLNELVPFKYSARLAF